CCHGTTAVREGWGADDCVQRAGREYVARDSPDRLRLVGSIRPGNPCYGIVREPRATRTIPERRACRNPCAWLRRRLGHTRNRRYNISDVSSGETITTFPGDPVSIGDIAWSPSSDQLVVTGTSGSVSLWSLEDCLR